MTTNDSYRIKYKNDDDNGVEKETHITPSVCRIFFRVYQYINT